MRYIRFPEDHMKLSVSVYSFGRYVQALGIEGVIKKTAEMGFDGIEFVDAVGDFRVTKENAKELAGLCGAAGLDIAAFCVGADFLNGSEGDCEKEVEKVKEKVDVAALLGAPTMRHDVSQGYKDGRKTGLSYAYNLDRLAGCCREVTEYAKSKGIVTVTENHGCFSQDADRVISLVEKVGNENFGMLVDIGNFMCADEKPSVSVGKAAPYARHVHIKDFYLRSGELTDPGKGYFRTRGGDRLKGTIAGHGDVGVKQCLRNLLSAGYDGWLSIEFEGMEDNLAAISIGRSNILRYLEELK